MSTLSSRGSRPANRGQGPDEWTKVAAKHGKVVCATAVKNRAGVAFAVALAAAHAVSTGTPQV